MIHNKDLIALADLYVEIDPSISSALLTLSNCRIADLNINEGSFSLEQVFMNLCVSMSDHALNSVNYNNWIKVGGTER